MRDARIAWQKFIKGCYIDNNVVRNVVYESWKRCRDLGINPYLKSISKILIEEDFSNVLKCNKKFIEISTPYMNNLYEFVRDSGFIISLINFEGIILKIIGDKSLKDKLKKGGFVEGSNWSEDSVGTNAIGTSLFIKEPLQVFSNEHYCRFAQASSCSCSPIKNIDGEVIGAINLTGYDNNVNTHTLGMAVASAYAIQNALIMDNNQETIIMSDVYKTTIFDSIAQGILATDIEGKITHLNSVAKNMLKLNREKYYNNESIYEVLPKNNEKLFSVIRELSLIEDKEITINTKRGIYKFNITSRFINNREGGCSGIVLIIDEIKRTRRMARNLSGAVASITFDDLIGSSSNFMKTVDIAKRASMSDSTVLLLGESGTGKDVIAQSIHNGSNRKNGPYIVINCGAIPRELIGSELFGYAEGAFTGARKGGSIGKFELADGGTIFLDEIGDMPLDMQTNLLRVIEEKRITRIGGQDVIHVDVRIITATNKDLREEVKNNRFRQDLFYRLNVITLHLYPLRERKDDIPELSKAFYVQLIKNMNKKEYPIPDDFLDILCNYDYPGNIRELQNIIEQSINLSINGLLSKDLLPEEVLSSLNKNSTNKVKRNDNLSIDEFEKSKIEELLAKHDGNISKVSYDMGIARSTLYRKLNKYGFTKSITTE